MIKSMDGSKHKVRCTWKMGGFSGRKQMPQSRALESTVKSLTTELSEHDDDDDGGGTAAGAVEPRTTVHSSSLLSTTTTTCGCGG
jgi:hypothetical protein